MAFSLKSNAIGTELRWVLCHIFPSRSERVAVPPYVTSLILAIKTPQERSFNDYTTVTFTFATLMLCSLVDGTSNESHAECLLRFQN